MGTQSPEPSWHEETAAICNTRSAWVCVCERTLLVLSVCVLCVYVCVDVNVVVCVLLLDRYQGLHFVGPTFVCLCIVAGLILRVVLMLIVVMC